MVEHHLAKVDVASSSLVTRSSLRLERSANRRLERAHRSFGEGGRPNAPSNGWQASLVMYYVYLLKSRSRPTQSYIGSTCDLRQRLKQHDAGRSPHTAKFQPWTLRAYVAFADEKTAVTFERYLKSGSGTLVRQSTLSLGSIDVSLAKTCRTPLAQSPRRLSPSKGFRPPRDRTPTRA